MERHTEFNPSKHKNIIFDLGGVILNIDYHLTVKAFKDLGLDNFQEHFSQAQQTQLFDKYEKGLISTDDFRKEIKTHLPEGITDVQIDDAWNAILLDLPEERLALLRRLKANHRLFLLSNTNELHILSFNERFRQLYPEAALSTYFEKMYLSYEVGMRKPDAEIFEFVLRDNQLAADETLFIDDSIQHVNSASALGIDSIFLDLKERTVVDLFPDHLIS
jgi:putative hydrolase of the HAD superfamily